LKRTEALVFSEATEENLEILTGLYKELTGEDSLTAELARAGLRSIQAYPCYKIFLGFLDGCPVCTYSILIAPNLSRGGKPWAVVENVIISELYQGLGIGRRMMEHAIALAVLEGCYKLSLSSSIVRLGAHAFYKKIGFIREGIGFYFNLEEGGPCLNYTAIPAVPTDPTVPQNF